MDFYSFNINLSVAISSIKSVPNVLRKFGFPKRLAVITGGTTYKIAGRTIADSLSSEGYDVRVELKSEATFKEGDELSERLKGVEGVVAVGGGSVIDLSKYVANKIGAMLASVPTNLSSDAIATPFSVLWKDGVSVAVRTKMPELVIGDIELLKGQPDRFISAGLGDMFAKITALYDWKLGYWFGDEPYSDFAANLANNMLRIVIKRLDHIVRKTYIGIKTLFMAEVTDAYLMSIAGTTRVAAGSEHLFALALTNINPVAGIHGEYVALGILPISYLQGRDWRKVERLLRRAGLKTNARELGLDREEVIKAMVEAPKMRNWYTILGHGLSRSKAERLLKYTEIID